MIINCDIDGVVRDFNSSVERVYKKVYPAGVTVKNDQWGLEHQYPDMGERIYDFVWKGWTWDIFANADPYPLAIKMLGSMKDMGHRIQLITANTETSFLPTASWVANHKVPFDSIHFTHSKDIVGGDILFDDKVNNLEMCKDKMWVVCVNRDWNQEWEGDRVFSCQEAVDMVRKA